MQSFVIFKYPKNTAVVCHDAGAANIIIENLTKVARNDWRVYMVGPAEKIWQKAFPEILSYTSLHSLLDGVDLLITGTGWASDIEYKARKLAKSNGIRSIAMIDHWINYAERFVRNGETVWPDEFWVTDNYAMDIAKREFRGQIINKVRNYYIDSELECITHVDLVNDPVLLYVLEPARSDWGRGMQGEFQALDYFISCLPNMGLPKEIKLLLRLHPSEACGKYDDWITKHSNYTIEIDSSSRISESISRSIWVAGCESFALILALMSKRKVFCTLPPWAPVCRLPHYDLVHLNQMDVL